jgi:hypothetical protein
MSSLISDGTLDLEEGFDEISFFEFVRLHYPLLPNKQNYKEMEKFVSGLSDMEKVVLRVNISRSLPQHVELYDMWMDMLEQRTR